MFASERVKKILDGYESDNPGTRANLARILMQGKLGGQIGRASCRERVCLVV